MVKHLLLLIISVFLFIGCGGGSSSNSKDEIKSSVAVNTSDVKLNKNLTYYVSLGNKIQEYNNNETIVFDEEIEEQTPVILSNEHDEPILIGRSFGDSKNVEVSISSTAEIFVLANNKFIGETINNHRELSNRIRNHESFDELISILLNQIEFSPCPLNRNCSYRAGLVADSIADSIEIDDLKE